MGKAFTQEEREELQEKLRRTGLKLLAENGIRNISIRQLTSQVGIAQGGFYSFYKDKDDFVEDLFLLRIREKTDLMYEQRNDTLDDPRGFIAGFLYREGMHLKQNKAFVNSESDTIKFFQNNKRDRSFELYNSFLKRMISFWEDNGYAIECDVEKIISIGRAAGMLFVNSELIGEEHFADIYRVFCEAETDSFFICKKRSDTVPEAGNEKIR
ncbi:MAG: TetR family transcriptional regulator [Lachnospiraceae bacterium]|nr:TetR family transcriptional regulator [Lachnospiraceae bacterium]